MNKNYYEGINPMRRVLEARGRRYNAVQAAMAARHAMLGEQLPLPEGYRVSCGCIVTPGVQLEGYGLTSDGTLCYPMAQGSVENHWLEDLDPATLLHVTKAVEMGVAEIVADLSKYAEDCKRVSAERLAQSAPALAALVGVDMAVKKLRDAAEQLEGGAK